MSAQNKNDDKLEKLLRENRPVVPGAPAGELAALAARLEKSKAAPFARPARRPWFLTQAFALAACLVLIVSVFVVKQMRAPGHPSDEELVGFAYETLSHGSGEVSDADDSVLAYYPLDELVD